MRTPGSGGIVRRITGAVLLAQLPFVLAGSLEVHLQHPAGQIETTIFIDASHAGQAAHWEAAETIWPRPCTACLLPGQPLEPPSVGVVGHLHPEAGRTSAAATAGLPHPGTGRPHRPRAPPLSGLA